MFYAFAQGSGGEPPILLQFLPFIVLLAVFWFILIRPQQKKLKKHQEFLTTLKRGDEVITASGIFGTVEGLTDRFVTLEVAEDVKIRILKNQVAGPAKEVEQ